MQIFACNMNGVMKPQAVVIAAVVIASERSHALRSIQRFTMAVFIGWHACNENRGYSHGGGVRREQYAKLLKILSVVCRD